MNDVTKPRFTIVGAGLNGSLMTTYLGQAGYNVDLYEHRPDPRAGGLVGGRSINLAISARGVHALQEVGIADEVLKLAIPMRGRMIHSATGGLSFQPYDKDPSRCINSISRAGLNIAALDAAEKCAGVRLHFEHKCVDADLERPAGVFENGERQVTAEGDILIGADGAFSAVRRAMQRLDRFDYRQDWLSHGYKELTIPPRPNGEHRIERNALHIWPRKSFMMIALPNPDGTFTCTIFWPFEGPNSFAQVKTGADAKRFFERHFPDAVPLMPTLEEDFERNATGSLVTVRCGPWFCEDKVVLVGDAAHAVVPFYGQGMNAGFEDCSALNECIGRFAPDWRRVFREYHQRRKINGDAIADLALSNFIEMRDHAASPMFRAKKLAERMLHRLPGGWYTPLYTMVSFTLIPYAEAVRRARRQSRIFAVAAILIVALLFLVAVGIWP